MNINLPRNYGPYVTFAYTMADYWTQQAVSFTIYYALIQGIHNFTFPYNSYSVVMERSDTYEDFGFLNFGAAGLTVAYIDRPLLEHNSVSAALAHIDGRGSGGIALIDSNMRRVYLIAINGSHGRLQAFRIEGLSRTLLADAAIPGFSSRAIYNITLSHRWDGSRNVVEARLYGAQGALLATISFTDGRFRPAFAGLAVYAADRVFADFIFVRLAAHSSALGGVVVENVPQGYTVELYSQGNLLARAVSPGGNVSLSIPLSTRGDMFRILYPGDLRCLETRGVEARAGDVYRLYMAAYSYSLQQRAFEARVGYAGNVTNFTMVRFSITGSPGFVAILRVADPAASPYLYLEAYVLSNDGRRSEPLKIEAGSVARRETSPLALSGGPHSILVAARFTRPAESHTLALELAFCNDNLSVCVSTGLTLTVRSPTSP